MSGIQRCVPYVFGLAALFHLQPAVAQSLVATPSALTFTSVADSGTPFTPQTVLLISTGANLPFVLVQSNVYPWVTPSSGTTPATITFAPPIGTAAYGTTTASIFFAINQSPILDAGQAPVGVAMTFTLPPPPVLGAVVDAASFLPGPISPGEMVAIFGENIGPLYDMTKLFQTGPLVEFPTESGSTQVRVSNSSGVLIAFAPILYAAKGQVNFIVPQKVAGQSNVMIQLTHYGPATAVLTVPVTDTTPAIFSANGQGSGPGAILNTNSSLNSASNPAPKGSIVQIFAEGAGL